MGSEPGDWYVFRSGAVCSWIQGRPYSGGEGDRYRLRFDPDNRDWNSELALHDTVRGFDLYSEAYAPEDKVLLRALQGMVYELNRLAKLLEEKGVMDV